MGSFLQASGRIISSLRHRKSPTLKRSHLSRQLGFESLETRRLMAIDVSIAIFGNGGSSSYIGSHAVEPTLPERTVSGGQLLISANIPYFGDATVSFTIGGNAKYGIDYVLEPQDSYDVTLSGNGGTINFYSDPLYGSSPYTTAGFNVIVLNDDHFEWPEDITVAIDTATASIAGVPETTNDISDPDYDSMAIVDSGVDPFSEITDPGATCEECTPGLSSTSNGSSGSANPKSLLSGGISANNGSVRVNNNLQSSNGSGNDFGTSLTWSNSAANLTSDFGRGMSNAYQPRLTVNTDTDDVLVSLGTAKTFFYKDGSNYVPYHSGISSLSYNSGTHQYSYVDTTGSTFIFYDDADDIVSLSGMPARAIEALKGQILSVTDQYGNVTTYEYDINTTTPGDSTGKLLSISRTANSVVESWIYSYVNSGDNEGLVSSIEYKIDAVAVRTSLFGYYEDSVDGSGYYLTMARTLRSTIVTEGDAMGDVLEQAYYRYYGENDYDGYVGGLKMLLRTEAIKRVSESLSTNLGDLDEITDEDLLDYADLHYKYDSEKRVIELTALGEGCTICSASGEGTYSYAYTTSSNADGYNSWKTKTIETLPDGTQQIYYLNYAGQKMLDITKVGSDEWITYYQYDGQGRLILEAGPSAVTGYDDYQADLLYDVSGDLTYLSNDTGQLTTYSYYSSTTATASTAGAALDYLSGIAIQHGENGTSIPQQTIQYYAHQSEVDSTYVYPVATQTVYRNDNGTGGQTTSYAYTWREVGSDETNQILATTVTSAFVSSTQNGSNATESNITVNDEFGRPVWMKDSAGFISYTAYDNATGAVIKMIRDVNTATTSDFANKPSGWTTPSGGGLHLKTTYEVDNLGRTIKMVDPKGNITFTVYNDAANEIRTYRGWNATNQRPAGPVEVSRRELVGTYTHDSNTYYGTFTQNLSYSVFGSLEVDGTGRPKGNETINGSGSGIGFTYTTTLQTLSRNLSNAGGQLIKSDQYYDFTGTTYTTSTFALTGADSDNYNRTEYVYDSRGRQARVLDAEGMITRTVYDKLGRVVSTWVGTDDTPAYPYELWSPTNNGGNMVQLNENEYDHGGVGDGNLTKSTQIPGQAWGTLDTALDNRVTEYYFDWRNRLVAVKSGITDDPMTEDTDLNRAISYTQYNNRNQAIASYIYDGDGEEVFFTAGVPDQPSSSLLRAKSTADYDDQGRMYKSTQYEVDQTSGTIGSNTIVTQSFHDIRGLTSKTRDARGNDTTYSYDGVGRQTTMTTADPDGSGTAYVSIVSQTNYDANGNVTSSVLNPASDNFITAYTYDALDRRLTITQPDPDGSGTTYTSPVTTYAYNAAGWLETVTDPLSRVTKTEYDRLGRTIKTTLPDPTYGTITVNSPIYQTTFNGVGNVLTSTDALGNVTTYGYNALHQRTSTTQPAAYNNGVWSNPVSEAVYTTGGDLLSTTDPEGRTTEYAYDLLGRQNLVTMPDPDGAGTKVSATMAYTYDSLGGVLTTTNALNHVTSSTYDGFHRLLTSTNANGEETSFTYDANGNRLTLTDPESNTTTWVYDTLNRVTSETNELNKTRTFSYDTAGRLKVRTDRRGWTIEYNYDNLSRVTSEVWDTSTTSPITAYSWTYDALGQLQGVDAADSLVVDYAYQYDYLGRLRNILYAYEPTGYQKSVWYSYNAMNSLTQIDEYGTSNGWTTSYTLGGTVNIYDNLQRLETMKVGDNSYRYQRADFAYNATGQIMAMERHDTYASFTSPSSSTLLVRTEYQYDDAGRIKNLLHKDSSNNPFAEYGYTWDAADRIEAIDFLDSVYDDEDVTYTLDDAGQVTGADRSGSGAVQDETYVLDDNGNRTSVTRDGVTDSWGATANNQLSTDGEYNYYYDFEGNRTSRVKLDSLGAETLERREFKWDHRNRLIEVKDYNTSNSVVQEVDFSYNHENLLTFRIRSAAGSSTAYTRYEFNGSHLDVDYGEWHGSTSYGHRIVYGPMTNMALFDVTGPIDSNGVYVLLGDHQHTVRDMVHRNATTGDVEHVNHIQYDSFGNIKDQSYTGSDLVVVIGYTGSYYERYSGMVYNWNRWYDPNAGRWISEDPIGFAGGDVNLGRYVGNESTIYLDSIGLATPSAIGAPAAVAGSTTYGEAASILIGLGFGQSEADDFIRLHNPRIWGRNQQRINPQPAPAPAPAAPAAPAPVNPPLGLNDILNLASKAGEFLTKSYALIKTIEAAKELYDRYHCPLDCIAELLKGPALIIKAFSPESNWPKADGNNRRTQDYAFPSLWKAAKHEHAFGTTSHKNVINNFNKFPNFSKGNIPAPVDIVSHLDEYRNTIATPTQKLIDKLIKCKAESGPATRKIFEPAIALLKAFDKEYNEPLRRRSFDERNNVDWRTRRM